MENDDGPASTPGADLGRAQACALSILSWTMALSLLPDRSWDIGTCTDDRCF
jgi:hypothetical protein